MEAEIMSMEKQIQDKAYELGYEKCGIIRIEDLEGYDEKMQERIEKVPESAMFYERQKRLTNLKEKYPWAKSVVVAVSQYGYYKVPEHMEGHIGKHYIVDRRSNPDAKEFKRSILMEEFLKDIGLKTETNWNFGIIGVRWAAMKAGLGIIRRNNFFYTESGSYVGLEAWLTDKDMELKGACDLPKCPKNCSNCIKACPTASLTEPYTMNPVRCVSFLTTIDRHDLEVNPVSKDFDSWFFGCDACQDACPMNKGKWKQKEEFPGLSQIAPYLSPENIMEMEEEFYKENIQSKYFYLGPDELWKWKVNVLNFMRNNYRESYKKYIIEACDNGNEKIRNMAKKIQEELFG
jgi:epoxyqueuosine reductase